MSSEQSSPRMGQTGQLAARHRQQGPIVCPARQLIEHVETLPHCFPEDLAQNLVHLSSAILPGCTGRIPSMSATAVLLTPAQLRKVRAPVEPVMGCAALIGRAMTVNGTS
jgi:hypothetical protein